MLDEYKNIVNEYYDINVFKICEFCDIIKKNFLLIWFKIKVH